MSRTTPLQRLLDPLSITEFIECYFEKRPLYIPGRRGKFDFLFREREFPVNLDRVDSLRAVFGGNKHAHIRPTDIKQMIEAGATICVSGMEMAHARLAKTGRLVRSELKYPGTVTFRAYLSPPNAGFDLHYDARTTTTLQIAGSKKWMFSRAPAMPFPMYNSGGDPLGQVAAEEVPAEDEFETVVLQPGDVLCLPPGVWHQAKAEPNTASLALNMAIDYFGAGVFDSIIGLLGQRLKQEPAWRQPLPPAPHHPMNRVPKPVADALRERIDALQAELSHLRADEAELHRLWQLALQSPLS